MNILFFSSHPAQIHNFHILKDLLDLKGHGIYWVSTHKDISKYLLSKYKIDYFEIKKPGNNYFSKLSSLIKNTYKCIGIIRRTKIDLIISRVSPFAALSGYLTNTPHISLADTESSGFYNTFFAWFTSVIITASSFKKQLRSDQIRYDGNIELFYLHPHYFTPIKRDELDELLGIMEDERYIIIRFVNWEAYHDKGLSGFTNENKFKAVEEFSKYARVLISSESELPLELENYRINIPPEKMHDVLAHATLFFGESATMASESAVLGTPAIYLNRNWLGYIEEESEYELLYTFKDTKEEQAKSINKGVELLQDPYIKEKTMQKRNKFLIDKIDVTSFMVWFIENYPESLKIIKENPDYQYNFK
jgi:uncharacterized protein